MEQGGEQQRTPPRVTIASLCRAAVKPGAAPFAVLTCYDATSARWLARAGVPMLLVGDTAAEIVLGHPRTIDMPLEVLLALTAGVKRGGAQGGGALVMGDMPFMSYQASPDDAMRNAGRFLTEGLADIVKLEADAGLAPLVERMVSAGIPVCGHIGSKPQRAAVTGGYTSAGRTTADANTIVGDAQALQQAGCSMLLLEAVPQETARRVLDATKIPVIGIGAGPDCHGQVLVLHDLLGLTDAAPAFAAAVDSLGERIKHAGEQWVSMVAERRVAPSPYSMRDPSVHTRSKK